MTKQSPKFSEPVPEHILALSWDISTEPKLYWELALNPYTPRAQQIMTERFPRESTVDIIRAVLLAEPEGRYDRVVKLLGSPEQEAELHKQESKSIIMKERLDQFCRIHEKEFAQLPKEYIYSSLSKVVFESGDLKEIEQRYSQNQRRDFRLEIVNYIEKNNRPIRRLQKKHPNPTGIFLSAVFVFLFVILLYHSVNNLHDLQTEQRSIQAKEQVFVNEVEEENRVFTTRLIIPSINVYAAVEYVGVTTGGEMDVPKNTANVGLFKHGSRPGEKGSAVIAGHVDDEFGEGAVFANLDKLKKGDKLFIEGDGETTTAFVVQGSRVYDPGQADEVFSRNDGYYINLITCDGVWDETIESYSKRLVVFANLLEE